MAPAIGVSVCFVAVAIAGAIGGWLPRTVWTVLLMVLAGGFLIFALSLTPPVLHARERMLKADIIEPTQMDEEPDLSSSGADEGNPDKQSTE